MNSFRSLSVLGTHFAEPEDMNVSLLRRSASYRYHQECIYEYFSILECEFTDQNKLAETMNTSLRGRYLSRVEAAKSPSLTVWILLLIQRSLQTSLQDSDRFYWSSQAGDRRI